MWIGIPGTNIGVDLDVPDPTSFAQDMMGKISNLFSSIVNVLSNFVKTAAGQIGSGVHGFLTDVPNQLFSGVIDGIKTFWKAIKGEN